MAKLNHELKGRDKGKYGKHTPTPVTKSNKGLVVVIIAVVIIAIAAVLIF